MSFRLWGASLQPAAVGMAMLYVRPPVGVTELLTGMRPTSHERSTPATVDPVDRVLGAGEDVLARAGVRSEMLPAAAEDLPATSSGPMPLLYVRSPAAL